MTTPAYLTAADLAAYFSAEEMTQLAESGTDAAALIAAVNAEVHSYLAALIGTAVLASVPLGVKVKAADIARFYLSKDSAGELAVKRWEAANAYLLGVAKGQIPLALDLADNPATEGDDTASIGVWSEPGTALSASEWKFL